eukprot:TRINITY_DN12133_c0_g1_i1.p1 TRINITY_DN12133_c0_g1~~TRINITY_DN12133_c0_g1_i1.p1  ORF type:complete len:161 (-),score=24.93 TRINITY_DN12133_c0_g1_i1:118-600(-)
MVMRKVAIAKKKSKTKPTVEAAAAPADSNARLSVLKTLLQSCQERLGNRDDASGARYDDLVSNLRQRSQGGDVNAIDEENNKSSALAGDAVFADFAASLPDDDAETFDGSVDGDNGAEDVSSRERTVRRLEHALRRSPRIRKANVRVVRLRGADDLELVL